ncbi:alpha-L-arabinofuranosidase [Tessaracoccus rhinocerotis]|uniref:non-reducing end alpha-L-arabinofuranosidase n=1 Tax=Tessaracoccus rhinocerotis TaxID=1689449 RepID=A0A553K4T0_9ACTN|nr:alpha-L-arabinofuranosidase C-terminal domain-containing protein [Tessaracoccus rhinocerotis]TRY19707.1 alpha-L-arabinofuranosidase [Tessaracoccus rhinocerotis]
MTIARLVINPSFKVGPVRRRTFGSFVEHLGRCVYEGIFEPDHPTADADGFRSDVLDLVRELGISTVRYPGGNFLSGYRWEDGVGPVDQRPKRLDLAWHSSDPNTIGTDEFMKWADKAGVEPMMAVNLGTRGLQEALDVLEYCNVAADSHLAEQRRNNGAHDPYRVGLWCLGNEMDGPWQIGHKSAAEYGRLAAEVARGMRMMDPGLELVACGSSSRAMPTFGEWERTVLTEAWDHVDMISAHAYYWEKESGLQEFLLGAEDMDRFIDQVAATADTVAAARKSDKVIGISFDEWNVWYQDRTPSKPPTGDDWPVAPNLLEDTYSVADAVVVGNLLISLLRHTDRVWVANQAQLVNVIAPIRTEKGGKAWKQTIFHPFALTSRHAAGEVLRVVVDGPTVASEEFGEVQAVDAVATWSDDECVVFLVNRDESASVTAACEVPAGLRVVEALTYANADPRWHASADDDTTVLPTANDSVRLVGTDLELELPPISWTMARLAR